MSEENRNETADQQAENQTAGENQTGTDSQRQSEEKNTFTQEDVNNIAAKEARKAQEKLFKELGIEDFENAKEGFQKFQQWQEQQKTESEKQSDELDKQKKANEAVQSENDTLKAQLSALKAGVITESIDDVVTLAKGIINDEVDMDAAIKQIVEKYPQFAEVKQEEEQKPSFTTGQHQSNGHNSDPFAAKLAKYK